jgi:transposase InsO family protein
LVFLRIYPDMETTSAVDFLNRLHEAAPMCIVKLLTDNGACFTDRFQRKSRTPSGKHHFDVRCRAFGIEHRLCPPRHPQTNGLVERFNRRVADVVAQTRFRSAAELEHTGHCPSSSRALSAFISASREVKVTCSPPAVPR